MLKDVHFSKSYFQQKENVVKKYLNKYNLDGRKLKERFFDGLYETFINQSKFMNLQKLMGKITDDTELRKTAMQNLED